MSNKLRPRQYRDQKGVIVEDFAGNGLLAAGTTVPADASVGYAAGCIFIDVDAAIGAQFYINEGSATSSLFHVIALGGLDLSTLLATATEINRNNKASTRLVASGSSLTVTQALHDGKTIVLAAASANTLPAMSGSGSRFRFVCGVDATAVTITATAAHLFGSLLLNTDSAFQAGTLFTVGGAANGGGSTVITLDGSTRGGHKGDWVEIEDVAANVGIVRGILNGSGTEATPFS